MLNISKSLFSVVAALFAGVSPFAAQAALSVGEATPPGYNSACNCYRNVSYGSTTWLEPTTKKVTQQVMDIWMPASGFSGPRPVVYYGHPNGVNQYIALDKTAGSLYTRLVKPLTDKGYIVVSYEFRHPVVNYVAGSPTPRYDIQRAINTFVNSYAAGLNADPANSFIAGQSRGGGLGLLTALTGKFTGGTTIRAVWTYQAQTTFNCDEMAKDFVIESDRDEFMTQCTVVPSAGSSLQAVAAGAPPVHAAYDRPFRMQLVPASQVDVHYPDFGYQLCRRYQVESITSGFCEGVENVSNDKAWVGMAEYFTTYHVAQ